MKKLFLTFAIIVLYSCGINTEDPYLSGQKRFYILLENNSVVDTIYHWTYENKSADATIHQWFTKNPDTINIDINPNGYLMDRKYIAEILNPFLDDNLVWDYLPLIRIENGLDYGETKRLFIKEN